MSRFKLEPYKPKPHYVPKIDKTEEGVQRRVCSYIRNHYGFAYFRSDTASGMKLSAHQRMIHHSQQSGPAQPDLMIFYPNRGFYGMMLELKAEGVTVKLKNGELTSNIHIRAQARVLDNLTNLGYFAEFAVGYDAAIRLIDWYFGAPENAELEF